MITTSNENVPKFIKQSELYQTIGNEETLTYPKQYSPFKIMKANNSEIKEINTFDELISILHLMRYWMVNNTPFVVYRYIRKHSSKLSKQQIEYLKDEFRDIKCLDEILILLDFQSYALSKNSISLFINSKNSTYTYTDTYIYTREREEDEYKSKMYCNDYYNDVKLVNEIIETENLNLLKYIHEEEKYNGWDFMAYNIAAEHGCLDILQYLFENNCPTTVPNDIYYVKLKACELAAKNGHLNCLKYLHNCKFKWDYCTIVAAAKNDHFDCVKYACENGCQFIEPRFYNLNSCITIYSSGAACTNDNSEMLQYVINKGALWNRDTLVHAIQVNSPKCLKYLVSIGGVIDKYVAQWLGGNLEILKFLNENDFDFEWTKNSYSIAAHKSLECLKYLFENVCTLPKGEKCIGICEHNCVDVENIYSDTLYSYLEGWKTKNCFDYLFEKGYRFSQNNYGSCIYNGYYKIMKYMYDVDMKEKGYSELSKLTIHEDGSESFIIKNMPHEDGVYKRISISWTCGYKYNKGDLENCYELAKNAGCKSKLRRRFRFTSSF